MTHEDGGGSVDDANEKVQEREDTWIAGIWTHALMFEVI